eukprot:m.14389 g.14389  ORF g.14389 m.14389 type:complete len:503 (+) comp5076_c0_seq1:91-1599(+)
MEAKGTADQEGMSVIGLTSCIGMRRVAVAAHFTNLGFPVQSAKEVVDELYNSPGDAAREVIQYAAKQNEDVRHADNPDIVDKVKLRSFLKDSPGERVVDIQNIIFPYVAKSRKDFIDRHRHTHWACVLDVPLLLESGADAECTHVVVASQEGEKSKGDENMDNLYSVLHAQHLPHETKRSRADFVIDTTDGLISQAKIKKQVAEICESLITHNTSAYHKRMLKAPPHIHREERKHTIKVVALDLDDTIWPVETWIKAVTEPGNDIIRQKLPKAYHEGHVRFAVPNEEKVQSTPDGSTIKPLNQFYAEEYAKEPLARHDISALRLKALDRILNEYGDTSDVHEINALFEVNRTRKAVDTLYSDTIPFLQSLKDKGVLIAGITDGTAQILETDELSKFFQLLISAASAGNPKPYAAPFLELLAKSSEALGHTITGDEVLIIGDNYEKDILGALGAHMHAAWIRRPEGQEPLPTPPDGDRPLDGVISISRLHLEDLESAGLIFPN